MNDNPETYESEIEYQCVECGEIYGDRDSCPECGSELARLYDSDRDEGELVF